MRFSTFLLSASGALTLGCAVTAREPIQPNCLERCDNQCKGWVIAELDVAPSGAVESAEIAEACPDNSFNWTALQSVKKWKFDPSAEGKQDHQVMLRR